MPIDASIPFRIKPVQIQDPVETYSKILGIRGQQQDQQLNAQQIEQNRTNMDQAAKARATAEKAAQRDADEENAIHGIVVASNGDLNKALPEIRKVARIKTYLDIEKTAGELRKTHAAATKDELDIEKDQNLRLAEITGQALAKDDATLAQDWPAIRASALAVNPNLQIPEQPLGRRELANFRTRFMVQGASAKEAADAAALEKAKADAITAQNQAITSKPDPITGLTPSQGATHADAAQTTDYKNYEISKKEGYKGTFEQWQTQDANRKRPTTNIYTPAAAPTDTTGKSRAATIDDVPPNLRSQVESVLNYGTKIPTLGRNNPTNSAIRDWVTKVDPNYSEGKFAERSKVISDFSPSGTTGKALTSTDTALSHLDTLSQAGKALKSGDIKILNQLATSLGIQTGSAAPVVYDAILNTVAPEISKAVIGANGGVEDRRKMAENFSRNLSDDAREGAIAGTVSLLSARFKKQADAYEQDMGKPLPRKLSKESQGVVDRYASGAGGGVPTIKTKAEYDALPKGAEYLEEDGKKYRKP